MQSKTRNCGDSGTLRTAHKTKKAYLPDGEANLITRNTKRKRNIIWFNPPFSQNVETKIGNRLLALFHFHFPVNHKLHKIFNRNSIKVSYSCMRNVKSIISSHNHKILQSKRSISTKTCNYITKTSCPLNNQCLLRNIVYKAIVSSENPELKKKVYFGISETPFKLRYANHLKSSKIIRYKNDTELSKEIWNFKEKGIAPIVKWRIVNLTNQNLRPVLL